MSYNPLPSIAIFYKECVEATNNIHTNVWAFLVIIFAVFVHSAGFQDIGRDMLIGGFALFKSTNTVTTTEVKKDSK